MEVKWDDADFQANMAHLTPSMREHANRAIDVVADNILRLSQQQVPLGLSKAEGGHPQEGHPGVLMASGKRQHTGDLEAIVGYHTPYAARLHEHPEYHFAHGRKGKYLEDPIKNNLDEHRDHFIREVEAGL